MELRRLLLFGSGVGIEISKADLEIAIVRVRPSGVQVAGRTTLRGFRERPAAEWGREYSGFLKSQGAGHLTATVLLPRREVIVRQIHLPGVAAKDMPNAIAFQLDSLHPYGDDAVAYGWTQIAGGAVLIGITRQETLDHYWQLFVEAGIAVRSFTFSAAALHAAVRVAAAPAPREFLAYRTTPAGGTEVYGESAARPVFSAEFDMPAERAAALAVSELRLGAEAAPQTLESLLPEPKSNPIANDLSRNAMPYATALAGACPRLAPAANLLPVERRAASSRAMYVPTAVLAAALVLVGGALMAHSSYEEKKYLEKLHGEISQIQRTAARAAALDKQIEQARARTRLLEEFRGRARQDLDTLNELTRLLPAPIWTNILEMARDTVVINGEAEQAASLLQMLDASPYFRNSEFMVPLNRSGSNEAFRIRTIREFPATPPAPKPPAPPSPVPAQPTGGLR